MAPSYRFFPWVRRGLSGALPPAAGPLPARAVAQVTITVTPELVAHRDVRLLGPGDVLGIDTRLIVRTEPRIGTPDFEPNYMAAIDFDAPELPWLFTPAGAGPDGKLQPWLVLVVIDRDLVAPPHVTRNRPLPFVKLPGRLSDTELPNLTDAWAWAHGQRLVAPGDSGDDSAELTKTPDLNVSRLVAPRRLAANRRWMACVVPAFDAGVATGLGRPRRDPDAALKPAWEAGQSDVELPVYYHWEFETGLVGDFEFLARRLNPIAVSANGVSPEARRRARVFLGLADQRAETLEAMPPSSPGAYARLDAPLELMDQPDATIAEAPRPFAEAVARAANPSTQELDELLQPLYGDRHARRFSVDPAQMEALWFDELNLDARTRVAARSGGDTVRKYQEDLMQAAWTQIGDILAANVQLSHSRFLAVVAQRALERHVNSLPPSRVLALTAVMHARVRVGDVTARARIAKTSLADATFDPSLRRLTSPVGRLSRAVARNVAPGERARARHALVRGIADALQRSEVIVDPSIVARDGIGGLALGVRAAVEGPIAADGRWTSGPIAGTETFNAAALSHVESTELPIAPRADLATVGVIAESHLQAIRAAATVSGLSDHEVMAQTRSAATFAPDAVRLAIQRPAKAGASPRVVALELHFDGSLVLADPAVRTRTPLLTVEGLNASNLNAFDALITRMPSRVLTAGTHRATVVETVERRDVTFELREDRFNVPDVPIVRPTMRLLNRVFPRDRVRITPDMAVVPAERLFDAAIPMPLRDSRSVAGITSAFQRLADTQPAVRERAFVKAELGGGERELAASVRGGIAPADVFRRRAASMVVTPEWLKPPSVDVFDPIMAAPVLKVALAELFARVAPERFLPLELDLPDESITALSTNPRFVAAFMVGANYEMNRELLWRTYPTDGRGTPLKRFWNWFEESRLDVDAIHAWPVAGPLVARLTGGVPRVVLVVRGRLLRRYPNTGVFAWKAEARGKLAAIPEGDRAARRTVVREPVFRLPLEPDMTIVGLDLTEEELTSTPEPGWYIVLQEPITEPRFGLDEPGTPAGRRRSRNDLNWSSTGVGPGGHLLAGTVLPAGARTAADVADALLQRPVRVALHGTQIAPAFPGRP
jgi:hypothetical protein